MKKQILISVRYTVITAILLGIGYPLLITAIAHGLFPAKAGGSLIERNRTVVGSELIGQTFSGDTYFHGRPSAAGTGYDATSSSGSNLATTSKALVDRVSASAAAEGNGVAVPVDLVTASASGLDPAISPAAALFQVARVAHARGLSDEAVHQLVLAHVTQRQFGLLGEPTVNVLQLNLALDQMKR